MFVIAGVSTVLTAALGYVARFPNVPIDLSGWNHWRMPAVRRDAAPSLEEGPVLVTEYQVPSDDAQRFTRADAALEQEILQYARNDPTIRHLIYASSE